METYIKAIMCIIFMIKLNISGPVRKKFNTAVMAKYGCLVESVDGVKVGHVSAEAEIALSKRADEIMAELDKSKKPVLDLESASHVEVKK